jgi:hypothetical protein
MLRYSIERRRAMTMTRSSGATALALALLLAAATPAAAQSAPEDPHRPATGPQAGSEPTPEPGADQGMMMNPHMMHEMMRQMMGQGMGPGMMQQMPGMMGQGPQGPMGPGMMGPGMMGPMARHGGMGWRITPMMHLGIEDVQHYLEHVIEAHELQHLKLGEVRQTDDDTITADLVTQEGSLALQLEVDRHTGLVKKIS